MYSVCTLNLFRQGVDYFADGELQAVDVGSAVGRADPVREASKRLDVHVLRPEHINKMHINNTLHMYMHYRPNDLPSHGHLDYDVVPLFSEVDHIRLPNKMKV